MYIVTSEKCSFNMLFRPFSTYGKDMPMKFKTKISRFIINFLFTLLASSLVVYLRTLSDVQHMYMQFEVGDQFFSVIELILIVSSSICGAKWGVVVYWEIFIAETAMGFDAYDGLFTLFTYFAVGLAAAFFSERGFYKTASRTMTAVVGLTLLIATQWYTVFYLGSVYETKYTVTIPKVLIAAFSEVSLSVIAVYCYYHFTPECIVKRFGIYNIYTSVFDESLVRHSPLGFKLTLTSLTEAVVIGLLSMRISNLRVRTVMRETRLGMAARQTLEEAAEEGVQAFVEASEGVLTNRESIESNLQLFFMILSIALPIAMAINSIVLRNVVKPIKNLSDIMTRFFNENEEEKATEAAELKNSVISCRKNEIGQLYRSLGHMLDDMTHYITEIKEKENLESELKVAEARSDAKSSFLSNMSHEIRTPINAVLGMNEMILRECEDESILSYSRNIESSGKTLLGLVNDILDFSKIEAGKLDIIPVDYDLASVLNDLVNMIKPRAVSKDLKVVVNLDPDTPSSLHGDEIRLKQIITNILTNAVKYTEEGSVTLDVGFEKASDDEIDLKVSVTDTGVGIKEEDMDKLFGAFERIDERKNLTVEGTGLGMSITRNLLSMMGSSLEVKSEYGKGSCFSFKVKQGIVDNRPIGDLSSALSRSLPEQHKYKVSFTAPDASILVVDDTEMNLTVFKSLLKKTKLNIDTALSGDDALRLTKNKKYNIIFLDHRMPVKDGLQTLAELKAMKDNPNADTPVLCLTANAVSGAKEMYISAGFTDYITKPLDPEKLEKTLVDYLPKELVTMAEDTSSAETQEAPEEEVPKELYAIREIDVKEGLKHCGTADVYMEAVKTYKNVSKDSADEIERLMAEGDIKNVTVKVHALKSTSRVIGAMDLGAFAERLEKSGNDNDTETLEKELGALIMRYKALGEELSKLFEDEERALPLIPAEELNEAYTVIREFLSVSDFESVMQIIDSLSGYSFPEEEKERAAALKKAASDVDYDRIAEILKETT